jgi:hypothetical protein
VALLPGFFNGVVAQAVEDERSTSTFQGREIVAARKAKHEGHLIRAPAHKESLG